MTHPEAIRFLLRRYTADAGEPDTEHATAFEECRRLAEAPSALDAVLKADNAAYARAQGWMAPQLGGKGI